MKFAHKKLVSRLSYGKNPESISHGLESVPGRDRKREGQTELR